MNKLLTKIATLSVGFAMALGIGIAAGGKAARRAEATPVELAQWHKVVNPNDNTKYVDSITSGFTGVYTSSAEQPTQLYRQDNSSAGTGATVGLYNSSSAILTTANTSGIVLNARIGGGSANKNLATNVFAYYLTNNGSKIEASQTYVTNHITTQTGDDYEINMPKPTTDVYGVAVYHVKESGYNVRYYSLSLTLDSDAQDATEWSVANVSGIYPGQTAQATVTATKPSASAILPSLTYSSGDESIFTVDNAGKITAVAGGSATLTVGAAGTEFTATATVTVTGFPAVDSRITVGGTSSYVIYAIDKSDSNNKYSLTGITSNYGAATVEDAGEIVKTYKFTIVSGIHPNTVAFRLSENTFLGYTWTAATGNNNLTTVTTTDDKPNEHSSWIVTDKQIILARTYGSDLSKARCLKLNHNNGTPRFACYLGTSFSDTYCAPEFFEIASQDLTGISVADISTYPGRTINVKNMVLPVPNGASLEGATYTFSSSNASAATIDENGVLTAVAAGNSTITINATVNAKAYQTTCTATVSNYGTLGGVTVGRYYVMSGMNGTDEYELTSFSSGAGLTTLVDGSYSKTYLFQVVEGLYTNTVGFMNSDGKYLAVAEATSNRTRFDDDLAVTSCWVVQYADSKYTISNALGYADGPRKLMFNTDGNKINHYIDGENMTSIILTEVTIPTTDFSLSLTEATMLVGATETISITYVPANATDKGGITWTSSNTDVATVANGVVTAKAPGEATITASKTIGESPVEKTCAVTVINNVAMHKGTEADPYTITEAYYIAKDVLTKDYEDQDVVKTGAFIKGLITKIDRAELAALTFWVGDNLQQVSAATKGFEVFKAGKVYAQAIDVRYASDDAVAAEFAVGATVIVKGNIFLYNSTTAEFTQGSGEISYSSYIEALTFARGFNTTIGGICVEATGNTDQTALGNAWSGQDTAYGQLEAIEKAHILEAASNKNGNDIEKMVAKYDYIVAKYNTSKTDPYNDFLGRIDSGDITLGVYRNVLEFNSTASGNSIIITIIIMSSVVVLGIGCYFFIRKKNRD